MYNADHNRDQPGAHTTHTHTQPELTKFRWTKAQVLFVMKIWHRKGKLRWISSALTVTLPSQNTWSILFEISWQHVATDEVPIVNNINP